MKNKILNNIIPLIKRSSKIALDYYENSDICFTLKNDNSILTKIDSAVQQFIENKLKELFPDHTIIGEEKDNLKLNINELPEFIWAIDPIDGTHSFATKLPGWCICIGLLKNGIPYFGAVYAPIINELYYAFSDDIAYMNNNKIFSLEKKLPFSENTSICADSKYLRNKTIKFPGKIRSFGSSALHILFSARGAVTASQSRTIYIWDIAAAASIAIASGCEFKYINGKKVDFSKLCNCKKSEDDIICSPNWAIDEIIKCFKTN